MIPLGPDLDRPWLDSPEDEREFWIQVEASLTRLWQSPDEGEPLPLLKAA